MPENSGRIIRLEAAAHVAASLPAWRSSKQITPGQLNTVLNQGPLADFQIVRNEDPHEFAFTDSIAFINGPFTVFPGIEDDSIFIVQHLLTAIFRHRRQIPNKAFLAKAFHLVLAVLLLSHEIARRAGLDRNIDPVYAPEQPVVIPKNNRLARLKKAVTFEESDVEKLLLKYGISSSSLEPLITTFEHIDLDAGGPHHGELFQCPIVREGNQFVIALPSRLLSALRHALITQTLSAGLRDELVARYTQAVWQTILESLYYLETHPATPQVNDLPRVPNVAEGVFHLDNDKALYVILATDPLTDYDTEHTFSTWKTRGLQQRIEQAVDAAVSHLLNLAQPPNDILVLELTQGIGRSYQLAIRSLKWLPFLYLGAADLSTIAQLEGGNKLMLWKYARASARIRETTEINTASLLDEFFLYRKHGYSYYLSDSEIYNFISVLPGNTCDLRQELRRERDWHWVRSYRHGQTIDLLEVTLLHSDTEIPIYSTKTGLFEGAIELLVEGLPIPVWITNARFQIEADASARGIYALLAEAVAYWLWQFTPSLTPYFSSLDKQYSRLLIEIRLDQPNTWETRATEIGEVPAIATDVKTDDGTIRMTFRPGMNFLLQGANNTGEREMMRFLLRALANLIPDQRSRKSFENAIEAFLERHAPISLKKKLLLFDANSVPELVREGLPPYRALQKADENELLDELGAHLTCDQGMQVGRIPDDHRVMVLGKAVGFFYCQLQNLVATLEPEGLLEWFVSYQEAAIRESAFHQLGIPTRLACFSSEKEMIEKLNKETPRYNLTVVASRFIIEYVTAQPPRGLRPMSMSVYDRLQALAAQIIEWGGESDLMHYNLVNYPLEILQTGRLGADRTQYQRANSEYMPSVMFGDIRRSRRAFEGLWRTGASRDPSADERLAALNAAAVAEFGFSISEQLDFAAAASSLGREINPGVARLPRADFLLRMATTMNQPRERISQLLEMLSLGPRANFLTPGSPYRSEDVYPWRYNRQLSYFRRPFLIRNNGANDQTSVEVIWGIRHLEGFAKNIVELCTEGRLKANSQEMLRLIGTFNRERGKRFNKKIADIFRLNQDLVVREAVKKVGSLKLLDDEGDLGDIDVLVADRKKKRLLIVECKDLAHARTPHEMFSELTNLFRGTEKKKPIVALHQRRVNWARQHVTEILEWLDIRVTKGWKVLPMIVVDRELLTPYLESSPIPITPIEALRESVSKHLRAN